MHRSSLTRLSLVETAGQEHRTAVKPEKEGFRPISINWGLQTMRDPRTYEKKDGPRGTPNFADVAGVDVVLILSESNLKTRATKRHGPVR